MMKRSITLFVSYCCYNHFYYLYYVGLPIMIIISLTSCQTVIGGTNTNSNTILSSTTTIGTRMTGVGSKSKKNKSIFLSSAKTLSSSSSSSSSSTIYVKIANNNELLFYFPSKSKREESTIVSLSANENYILKQWNRWKDGININNNNNNNNNNDDDDNISSIQARIWNQNSITSNDDNDNNTTTNENITVFKTTGSRKKKKKKKNKQKPKKRNQNYNYLFQSILSSSKSKYHHKNQLSKEWIPIEGIYGIYNLPSGPYLVLITDSESIYQSPLPSSSSSSSSTTTSTTTASGPTLPLINLRKIKSMEIIPLPYHLNKSTTNELNNNILSSFMTTHQKLIKNEQNQLNLLRQSFKEHDFYYCKNDDHGKNNHVGHYDYNDYVISDITHTLQRHFTFIKSKERMKKNEVGNNYKKNIMTTKLDFITNSSLLLSDNTDDDEPKSIARKLPTNNVSIQRHEGMNMGTNLLRGCTLYSGISNHCENIEFDVSWLFQYCQRNHNDNGKIDSPRHYWWTPLLREYGDIGLDSFNLRPDSRFFWNEKCIQPFLKQLSQSKSVEASSSTVPYELLLKCTKPVTSAFVGVQKDIELSSKSNNPNHSTSIYYDQLLISRRSKYRAGTRFTKRGADGNGDVANFAETEQICIVRNDVSDSSTSEIEEQHPFLEFYSHVQTRGSIPLRWSSPSDIKTYRPKVLIGTDPIAQARALRSHLIEQLSTYSFQSTKENMLKLVFVNLIDKHSDQGRLGKMFGSILDAVLNVYEKENDEFSSQKNMHSLSHDFVSYVWFDFHAQCKKGRWYKLRNLLDDIAPTLNSQGFFCASLQQLPHGLDWTIDRMQDGVVRTNCMDCLDRTNVVQSMFGRFILYKQFNERNGSVVNRTRRLPLEYIIGFKKDTLTLPWGNGETSHRLLWADNADAISRLYAGTPALKGDFTRTGKRTKRGALDDGLNSVTRFYLNNFVDADRQKGIDLLTGFTQFEVNDEEENLDSFKIAPKTLRHQFLRKEKALNEEAFNAFSQQNLNLGWLPGDLESHLRSAALTAQCKDSIIQNQGNTYSSLIDIGRRASSERPWWVEDNDEIAIDIENSPSLLSNSPKIGSGHVIGALVALNHYPVMIVISILFFLAPGMLQAGCT